MNGQDETTMSEEVEETKTYECFECDTEWTMVPELEEDVNGNTGREVEFCPYCGSSLHEPGFQPLHDDLDYAIKSDYDED
jgi:uncharacterized paraquat-inducible protein A